MDAGEGSCARLATDLDADFFITDDLRALPELQHATTAQVAISQFVLQALVNRDGLAPEDATAKLERLAQECD